MDAMECRHETIKSEMRLRVDGLIAELQNAVLQYEELIQKLEIELHVVKQSEWVGRHGDKHD